MCVRAGASALTVVDNGLVNPGILVRPLQARGEHNPRDFDKYIFQVPIPLYQPDNTNHQALVQLAEEAEHLAAAVELSPGTPFQVLRRRVRQALDLSRAKLVRTCSGNLSESVS